MVEEDKESSPILAEGDPSRQSCLERMRSVVTVEPVTFLYIMSYILSTTTIQQYASYYYAMELDGDPGLLTQGLCYVPTNSTTFVEQVEEDTANFLMVFSLLNVLPMIFASLLMGSYSDNRGRKVAMCAPVVGGLIRVVLSIIFVYTNQSMEYFYIAAAAEGVFGGSAVFETAVFAYIADVSTSKGRSWRMVMLLIAQALGIAVAEIGAGYLIAYLGFLYPLYVIAGAYVLCLLIIAFYIKETVRDQGPAHYFSFRHLLRIFQLLWRKDDKGRTWMLRVSSFITLLSYATQGILAYAMYLYVAQYPLCFNWIEVGYLVGAGMLMTSVGGMIAFRVLHRYLRDAGLLIFASVDAVLAMLYYTIPIYSVVYVYCQPLIGFVSALITPLARAFMSNSVDQTEQGAVQSIAAVCNVVGTLVGSVGASALYSATVYLYTGTVFVFGAMLFLIVLICAIAIWVRIRKHGLIDIYSQN